MHACIVNASLLRGKEPSPLTLQDAQRVNLSTCSEMENLGDNSNSCSVRRSDSPLMPYELLDRVYGSKGYWHDMMQADPPDRDLGLTQEELAAVQGVACLQPHHVKVAA